MNFQGTVLRLLRLMSSVTDKRSRTQTKIKFTWASPHFVFATSIFRILRLSRYIDWNECTSRTASLLALAAPIVLDLFSAGGRYDYTDFCARREWTIANLNYQRFGEFFAMPSNFDNLLVGQRLMIQLLSRNLTNYRKLGKDKFNAGKMRTRISELEKLWAEYRITHVQLLRAMTEEDQWKHEYFANKGFSRSTSRRRMRWWNCSHLWTPHQAIRSIRTIRL